MAISTGAALLGAGLGGALIGGSSSRSAARQVAGASDAATAEQRRQFDIATGLAQPAIGAGNAARDQLMRLLGLAPSGGSPNSFRTLGPAASGVGHVLGQLGDTGGPFGNLARQLQGREGLPTTARTQFGLDTGGAAGLRGPQGGASADPLDVIRNTPGYNFQLEQGTRALNANRSAGGISGGELTRDFARFNQGIASSFYQDYANRLAGLAGSAQTASATLGQQGIQSGANIGNTLINAGNARASGILGQGNAFGNLFNDIGGFIGQNGWPWTLSGGGGTGGARE